MSILPSGFRVAGHHCGLKQSSQQEDLSLFWSEVPCVAAAVYTKNQVVAAPVVIDRQRTPSDQIRAVIVNSGNANACTGEQGMQNAEHMLAWTGAATSVDPAQVLIMSTGIIGEQLPMPLLETGIPAVTAKLNSDQAALSAAARGILTTDTRSKIVTREVMGFRITGLAKGSGMIGPNMATMLSIILTDAPLAVETAQQMLQSVNENSFNAINVDGHTSTNDTLLLLANGQGECLTGERERDFREALQEVCVDLAKQIVDDGEGATHLVEIRVAGAETDEDARVIAEAVANSPLVKTAIAGNDPNWGRIVSAAGYAGPAIDVQRTSLRLNDVVLFAEGEPREFDPTEVSRSMEQNREVDIELVVGQGRGQARFWTCDLTHGYVTINADYHT